MQSIESDYTMETPRFLLRQPSAADIPHVFSAAQYPGFTDGMLWEPPATLAELQAPLERNLKAWEEGAGYTFTVEKKQDGTFLGRLSIRQTDTPQRWNVGFWTHPAQQGKGVMTEALARLLQFGFERLGAQVIEAEYATWNTASEKVLHRNGMQFVKHIEKGYQKHGRWVAENLVEVRKHLT